MTKPKDRKKISSEQEAPRLPRSAAISPDELAVFLSNLARIYRNPKTGNIALSDALFGLSTLVRERSYPTSTANPEFHIAAYSQVRSSVKGEALEQLKALDAAAVERFISDQRKTKAELLDLATARFAISRSRLLKIGIASVREAIRSALLHERSLKIISQEARRGGSQRTT